MRITNKANLPDPIVNAIRNDPYTKGEAHLSVTGLIAPARMKALEHRHWDDLEEDAADRIWSLQGQIMHGILERAADPTEGLVERRLFIKRYDWTISGQFDRMTFLDGALQDYKSTSTYTTRDGVKPEWEQQLNGYRLLMVENGLKPEKLQIVVIYRDWMKSKARHDPHYPQHPVGVLDVPMWTLEQTEAFILERLHAHGNAMRGDLPDCTDEERWRSPDTFAVIGEGNSRATKTFTDANEAQAFAEEKASAKKKYHVQKRDGVNRRCADYCAVGAAGFCDQWNKINPDRLGLMGGTLAA